MGFNSAFKGIKLKMEPAGVVEKLQACNSEVLGSTAPVCRLS